MKAYQDSRDMDPLISHLGNRCRLEVSFMKGPFTLGGGGGTLYRMKRRRGGPQSRSGRFGNPRSGPPSPLPSHCTRYPTLRTVTNSTINFNTASSTHAKIHTHTHTHLFTLEFFKRILQPADYIGTPASELFISSSLNATAEA